MKDIQLSEHFKLSEFVRSDTANRKGIDNMSLIRMAPGGDELSPQGKELVENMRWLCQKVLEPLRQHFGKPISINSGYRCPELNRAVGGARNSYHMKGRAADIPFKPGYLAYIRDHLPYVELINEGRWIHVAL